MLHWIWSKLFCWHDWQDISSGGLKYYDDFDREITHGKYFIQECSKCKSRRLLKVTTRKGGSYV